MPVIFENAVVLLTGASSGIGAAMARELAQPFPYGDNLQALLLVARRGDRLESLRAELTAANPQLTVALYSCDLTDRAAIDAMLTAALNTHGRIDILINNAGHGVSGLYDFAPWDSIDNMLELNIGALAYLTHRLAPAMVAHGSGGILNVSSGYGVVYGPGMAGYIGSKHFVTGFTEGLRVDLSGTGVTVTQVLPGPVETEFSEAMAQHSRQNQRIRLPKLITVSAQRCARVALHGLRHGKARIIPGFWMNLLLALSNFLPAGILRGLMSSKARWYRRQPLTAVPPAPSTPAS